MRWEQTQILLLGFCLCLPNPLAWGHSSANCWRYTQPGTPYENFTVIDLPAKIKIRSGYTQANPLIMMYICPRFTEATQASAACRYIETAKGYTQVTKRHKIQSKRRAECLIMACFTDMQASPGNPVPCSQMLHHF